MLRPGTTTVENGSVFIAPAVRRPFSPSLRYNPDIEVHPATAARQQRLSQTVVTTYPVPPVSSALVRSNAATMVSDRRIMARYSPASVGVAARAVRIMVR